MIVDTKWKKVSKEKFEKFRSEYKTNLIYDVCGIFDPPIGSYNDFSDGKIWPESVVCFVSLGKQSMIICPNEYFILLSLLGSNGK